MMYFTETDECPEDPIALNHAFEAEYDTEAYEKKISLLMAQAYRRIRREGGEKLHLWNEAFHVLSQGDHYILLFWRQNPFAKSPRNWPTYILGALAVAVLILFLHFFFGGKSALRPGQPAPVDRYLAPLSPLVQHILQFLFLLGLLFAIFPQLLSKLGELFPYSSQSTSLFRKRK